MHVHVQAPMPQPQAYHTPDLAVLHDRGGINASNYYLRSLTIVCPWVVSQFDYGDCELVSSQWLNVTLQKLTLLGPAVLRH